MAASKSDPKQLLWLSLHLSKEQLKLRYHPIIQRIYATFFVVLLLLTATPEDLFHTALADHTDVPGCTDNLSSAHLHEKTEDCKFDDLVVSTPFCFDAAPVELSFHTYAPQFNTEYVTALLIKTVVSKESRGPPVS